MDNRIYRFTANTAGHCFFCYEEIGRKSETRSIKAIFRCLNINLSETVTIPENLLKIADRLDVRVRLCKECEYAHEKFCELNNQMEMLRMKVNVALETVSSRIENGSNSQERVEKYRKGVKDDPYSNSHIKVVELLRNEVVAKCRSRMKDDWPRIKIQKEHLNEDKMNIEEQLKCKQDNSVESNGAIYGDVLQRSPSLPELEIVQTELKLGLVSRDNDSISINENDDASLPSPPDLDLIVTQSTSELEEKQARSNCTETKESLFEVLLRANRDYTSQMKCPKAKTIVSFSKTVPYHETVERNAETIDLECSEKEAISEDEALKMLEACSVSAVLDDTEDCTSFQNSGIEGDRDDLYDVEHISQSPDNSITDNDHSCEYCDKACKNFALLVKHVRYSCPVVKEHPQSASLIRNFLEKKKSVRAVYTCKICKEPYHTRGGVGMHMALKHGIQRKATNECDICRQKFVSTKNLRLHRDKVHFGIRYKCEHCFKMFTSAEGVTNHMKTFCTVLIEKGKIVSTGNISN